MIHRMPVSHLFSEGETTQESGYSESEPWLKCTGIERRTKRECRPFRRVCGVNPLPLCGHGRSQSQYASRRTVHMCTSPTGMPHGNHMRVTSRRDTLYLFQRNVEHTCLPILIYFNVLLSSRPRRHSQRHAHTPTQHAFNLILLIYT